MQAETSAEFVRTIPGVPTVYGVRFPGNPHEKVMFIREGMSVEDFTLREVASSSHTVRNLEQILRGYKTLWDSTMGVNGFELAYSEAKIVMCAPERSNRATIETVAPGFFLAHNRDFIAIFCPKYCAWSIEWIAVDSGDYGRVRLQRDEYLLADLDKGGCGLKNVRIRTLSDQDGFPDGEVGELYTVDVDEDIDFGEVDSMWVVIGHPELYAGTSEHTFVFDVSADDSYCCWKLFSCEIEEEQEGFRCAARGSDMFIGSRDWCFGPDEVLDAVFKRERENLIVQNH